MATLVTGGAGFIGSHVVERLLLTGHEVTVLDNFDTYYSPSIKERNIAAVKEHKLLHLIRGDITNPEDVERAFAASPVRAVLHLAAQPGVRRSITDPLLYERVNVWGTLNLLEASGRANVDRFVFASSASVYGATPTGPVRETAPINRPLSPYAATKSAGETFCYTYHHIYHFSTACVRLFSVYGPRQRPDLAIHTFVRGILDGNEIRIFGDGQTARDYTYIDDIVDGLIAVLSVQCPLEFEVFNLGNATPIALSSVVKMIEGCLKRTAKIRHMPEQMGDVPLTHADISKAQRLLGYTPLVPAEEGISRFCEWYMRARSTM